MVEVVEVGEKTSAAAAGAAPATAEGAPRTVVGGGAVERKGRVEPGRGENGEGHERRSLVKKPGREGPSDIGGRHRGMAYNCRRRRRLAALRRRLTHSALLEM
jgi:hypothetical protein